MQFCHHHRGAEGGNRKDIFYCVEQFHKSHRRNIKIMGEDLLWAVKNGDLDQLKVLIEEKVIMLLVWLD